MELVLPMNFVDIDQEEMMYLDGGIAVSTVIGVIAVCIAGQRGIYAAGSAAAQKLYYMGYRNKEYQSQKWFIRAGVVGMLGVIVGSVLLLGFENKFYSLTV